MKIEFRTHKNNPIQSLSGDETPGFETVGQFLLDFLWRLDRYRQPIVS